jgi:hypothetical protein
MTDGSAADYSAGRIERRRDRFMHHRQNGRAYLRYVEAGGYYAEPRICALNPDLIVDAPV